MTLQRSGYELSGSSIPSHTLEQLAETLAVGESRGGQRGVLKLSLVSALAEEYLRPLATSALGSEAVPVSATVFSKRPERNWRVPWHQDTSIAAEMEGLPTTSKDGVPHVQPGEHVLSKLVSIRVHIDDAGSQTGGLSVVPGSHLIGVIPETQIHAVVERLGAVNVERRRGSFLLMKPLLLHASSAMRFVTHRRVLHIVFAPAELLAAGGIRFTAA